jgi:hypothetical protein
MMTIEEEIRFLVDFLRHPAGFDVDMGGTLTIRPISEDSPPSHWAVDWEDVIDGVSVSQERCFPDDLEGAVQFFVEKRHYMCNGLDFNKIARDYHSETGHYMDEPGHPNCQVEVDKDE